LRLKPVNILFLVVYLLITSILSVTTQAQTVPETNNAVSDTVLSFSKHSPKRAAVFSAVLPGLGQAYNQRYIKIPFIYAGFAGLGYWAYIQNKNYQKFLNYYNILNNPSSTETVPYSEGEIDFYKKEFRRSRDLTFIIISGWYFLNIIDAVVDAHFYSFDVSPNLSLQIKPVYTPKSLLVADYNMMNFGVNCRFNFKY